jgi:hypothetical protein
MQIHILPVLIHVLYAYTYSLKQIYPFLSNVGEGGET